MNSSTGVTMDDTKVGEIENQTSLVMRQAGAIVISDDASLASAGVFLRGIKTILKRIGDTFDEPIRSAHESHKKIIAAKKEHADPLLGAEKTVKGLMGKYVAEQDRIRAEQQRRIDEEARQAEEKRRQEAKADEDRRIAEAQALEDSGKPEEAEAVLDAPEPESEPVIVQAAPAKPARIEGVSARKVWKWRLVSIAEVPREHLILDEKKINAVVKAWGESTKIPGIAVYPEQVIAAKGL